MNPLLFFLGIPVGALLGLVAIQLEKQLEKRYKGKSDILRGILLVLPFGILALVVAIVDILL